MRGPGTYPRRQFLVTGAVTLATLSLEGLALASSDLLVIVHRDNSQRLSTSEIEAVFRTTLRHWASGETVVPFNLAVGTAERVAFDRAALGLEPEKASRYWIDRKIRGGQPPPRTAPNPPLVARLVAELKSGIGYIPEGLLHGGVRAVGRVRGHALQVAAAWPYSVEEV